jgi:hypothetical protein
MTKKGWVHPYLFFFVDRLDLAGSSFFFVSLVFFLSLEDDEDFLLLFFLSLSRAKNSASSLLLSSPIRSTYTEGGLKPRLANSH